MLQKKRIEDEKNAVKILYNVLAVAMLVFLTGCAAVPAILEIAEDVASVAVEVEIDKEKLKKDTEGHLSIDVKDSPK